MPEQNKKLRILMMMHRQLDNSPYSFYVHEQAKALAARGHEVTVIACMGVVPMMKRLRPTLYAIANSTPEYAEVDGIPVYAPRCLSLGNAGEKYIGGAIFAHAALRIAKRLHHERPFDIVHAHTLPRDGHAGLIVARALGVPMALTVHGTDIFGYFKAGQAPWPRNVRIAREADALMAVSSLLLGKVAPYRGAGKITRVVPNGVDLTLVPAHPMNTPRHVISVGTLKARKCMDRTIEAFARVCGDYPDARLTIVGIGEMEDALRAQVKRLGVEDKVAFTGGLPHPEVLRRMGENDLFVLPSWGEGYGIVYIEAMAAGCIAVGAEKEGIEDTITHGENGFLVPAGDTDAVARVMQDVFAHREAYAALRARGKAAACALTWARNARTVEGIYEEAIAARRNEHAQARH